MKKIKKISLISLLLLLTIVIGITNVSAFTIGETFKMNDNQDIDLGDNPIKLKHPGYTRTYNYGSAIYTADYNGDTYKIYCMDPARHAPKDLYVHRTFSSDNGILAEDYGLGIIITAEKDDELFDDVSFKTANDDQFDLAKGLAARIYINGYLGWNLAEMKNDTTNRKIAIASLKELARVFNDRSYNPARDINGNQYSSQYASGLQSVISDAITLYRKGVDAKNNYYNEKHVKVEQNVVGLVSDVVEDGEEDPFAFNSGDSTGETSYDGPRTITKNVNKRFIVELKLTGFDKVKGSFMITGLENSIIDGISTRIVGISTQKSNEFTSDKYMPLDYNTDILETFKDSVETNEDGETVNLTVYLAVESTGTIELNVVDDDQSCDEDCSDSNPKVTYKYDDPKIFSGAVLYNLNNHTQDGTQRFLVASRNQNENTGFAEIPVDLCNSCEHYEPCEPVTCEGVNCLPGSSIPQVCSDDVLPGKDGLVEYKFLEAYSENGYEISKCLLEPQKDAANNSYVLRDEENASSVIDNPYCKIVCKEDYSIKLPYKQTVTAGRYFKLTLSLKGQQDCYSTKLNKEKFDQDVIAKEKELVDAFNHWQLYYELLNLDNDHALEYADPQQQQHCDMISCSGYSESDGCSIADDDGGSPGDADADDDEDKDEWKVHNMKVPLKFTYYAVDANGNVTGSSAALNNLLEDLKDDEGEDINLFGYVSKQTNKARGTHCASENNFNTIVCVRKQNYCKIVDAETEYNNKKPGFQEALNYYKTEVDKKTKELQEMFDRYNSCAGDKDYDAISAAYQGKSYWNMIYKYNPEIKYSYDEPNPSDLSNEKWIEKVKAISGDILFAKNEQILAEDCDENSAVECKKIGSTGTFKSPFYESIHGTIEGQDDKSVNTYCIGDINDDYSCAGTELNSLVDKSVAYETRRTFNCVFNNSSNRYECHDYYYYVTKVDYVHKAAYASGDYETKPVYYTNIRTGNIRISDNMLTKNKYTQVNGLPVSAETPQGTYYYVLNIENIGTFYQNGNPGRIFSSSPYSLATYARKSDLETYSITTGTGDMIDDVKDVEKELKVNEYACTYIVSQDTCTDADGKKHTEDECDYYETDADWNACKKRICPSDIVCTDDDGVNHGQDECYFGESSSSCIERLCPSSTDYFCEDQNGNKHQVDECNDYETPSACRRRICPGGDDTGGNICKDSSGRKHYDSECQEGETVANCKARVCPDGSGGDKNYCVREAEGYYICPNENYDSEKCVKANNRVEALQQTKVNVNCCPECKDPECLLPPDECPIPMKNRCTISLIGCDGEPVKLQYRFRTISPQNINPNNRNLGYNWDLHNASNELLAEKAANTISEIEARANGTSDGAVNISSLPEYTLKVVMTPDLINWVKDYNNNQENNGAYGNDTLTCNDYDVNDYTSEDTCESHGYTWKQVSESDTFKCVMSNVFCYSSFIDKLGKEYPDLLTAPNREESKTKAFEAYTGINNDRTDYQILTNDYWTIYKYDTLDVNGDGRADVGPSWK